MNKKAKELSDWYAELAKNDNGAKYYCDHENAIYLGESDNNWFTCNSGDYPNLNNNLDDYKVNPPKPIETFVLYDKFEKRIVHGNVFETYNLAMENFTSNKHMIPVQYEIVKLREVTDEN